MTGIMIEGPRGFYVATPAALLDHSREKAWADAKKHIRVRKDMAWIMGRYIETQQANQNGHIFGLDEIRDIHDGIVHTPLNINHEEQHVVGHFVATELVYPTGDRTTTAGEAAAEEAATQGDLENPFVEALSVMHKLAFPQEFADLQKAHAQGTSFYSMEAVPESLTCRTDGGCGQTYPYQGSQHDSYCAELNEIGSAKLLNKPHFVGGALILPPVRPGWRRADISEISALIERNVDQAEKVFAQIAAATPWLGDTEWTFLMELLMAGAFGEVPEIGTRRAPVRAEDEVGEFIGGLLERAKAALEGERAAGANLAGVIVAAVPPGPTTKALAALGDEPEDQIHMTIVFLGEASIESQSIPETGVTLEQVRTAVSAWAEEAPTIDAAISGLGRFALENKSEATYASVDGPGLPELYTELVEALGAAGIPVNHDHGFSPHITVAYKAAGKGPTEMPGPLAFPITAVELWWGDDHEKFQLGGGPITWDVDEAEAAKMTDPVVEKPEPKSKFDGVTIRKDSKGFYVHTHRARSKSFPTVAGIPASVIKFIESTG